MASGYVMSYNSIPIKLIAISVRGCTNAISHAMIALLCTRVVDSVATHIISDESYRDVMEIGNQFTIWA